MSEVSMAGEGKLWSTSRRTGGAAKVALPLWAVLVGGVIASIGVCLGVRALGRALLDVPAGLPSLALSALLPAAIFPVLGNCFGFFMSFRAKPSAHSMRLFIAIGIVMTAVGTAIAASKLPASASAGSVLTTLAVGLIPSVLIIAVLLLVVPRSAEQG